MLLPISPGSIKLACAVAVAAGLAFTHWWMYDHGKQIADARWEKENARAARAADEVRSALRVEGARISTALEQSVKGIRITNQTIVNEVRHEREVHHVLQDPNCAVPDSTVRLLNDARANRQPRPAGGEPAATVRPAGAIEAR